MYTIHKFKFTELCQLTDKTYYEDTLFCQNYFTCHTSGKCNTCLKMKKKTKIINQVLKKKI